MLSKREMHSFYLELQQLIDCKLLNWLPKFSDKEIKLIWYINCEYFLVSLLFCEIKLNSFGL